MTSLDLANPQHVEALRWACENWPCEPVSYFWPAERIEAIATLADPARAAELARGLLEQVGANVVVSRDRLYEEQPDGTFREHWWLDFYEGPEGVKEISEVEAAGLHRLVLALLDAKSAEEAMAAVREVVA